MLNPSFRRDDYNKKKRNQFLIRAGVVFAFLSVIFIGLVLLSRIDRFRISGVEFFGGLLVPAEGIKTETKNFLAGNYFWFFPKNNIFLYPHDSLENFLKDKFKRINTISVSKISNQSIKITITERGLYALWCEGLPDVNSPEKCYFMDNNGVIFSESPTFSGDAYFKYYGFIKSGVNPIGITYVDSISKFHELGLFIERIKSTAIRPVFLIADDTDKFDLVLSNGGHVYFDTSESFSKTADNLEVLLKTLISTTTSEDLNIDYIDLRFGNKLFYKLK